MSSRAEELADLLEGRLRALGTEERATGAQAYLKSDLVFLAVDTPTLRREVKHLLREEAPGLERESLLALGEEFWPRDVFELRAAATELVTQRVDLLEIRDLDLLERLIRDSRTWALVDALAPSITGPLVECEEASRPEIEATLDRLGRRRRLWLRRAALPRIEARSSVGVAFNRPTVLREQNLRARGNHAPTKSLHLLQPRHRGTSGEGTPSG